MIYFPQAIKEKRSVFKIDIGLIRGINANPKKQNLVKAIMSLCQPNKIASIGEGIETKEELDTLINLGVEAGQGYLLSRPAPEPYTEG